MSLYSRQSPTTPPHCSKFNKSNYTSLEFPLGILSESQNLTYDSAPPPGTLATYEHINGHNSPVIQVMGYPPSFLPHIPSPKAAVLSPLRFPKPT